MFKLTDAPDSGMTLRDYFAAKALAAMISKDNKEYDKRGAKGVRVLAYFAYEYADSMMAVRYENR